MTRKKLNVALIGAGYWGQKLLPKFNTRSDAGIAMVCDIHEENRAAIRNKFRDIHTTGAFDDVLHEQAIEAVVLATPPATHYALAKRLLEAGKNIWIEKPLALRLEEGRELVELAGDQKKVLFVDHTFLYDAAVRMIRQMIVNGELGAIHHLFLQRLNLGRIKRDSNVWWNSAPHDASILLYLLPGRPRDICLHGYRYLQPGLEDLNMAIVEMSDGASAFIYHNWLYPENTAKVTVVGSRRLLVYEGKFEKRSITVYDYELDRGKDTLARELPTTIPSKIVHQQELKGFREQEPLAAAVEDFFGSIRESRAPLSDGKFSLEVLAVLDAGERSLRANGARTAVDITT
jgi:UDP-2-acetamido-3-amino-2,3-dideoxy-glucuronate N-acetyltransferase